MLLNTATRYRHAVSVDGTQVLTTDSHELADSVVGDVLHEHPDADVRIRTTEIRDGRDRHSYETAYEL